MKKIVILCLMLPCSVYAIDCNDAKTQKEMTACAKIKNDKADKELNKIYNYVMSHLDRPNMEKLKRTERVWVSYKETHCNATAGLYDGGTMQEMIRYDCLTEVTKHRIINIENTYREFLANSEYDPDLKKTK